MKIIFAKNLGFCSGVKRAILIAKNSFQDNPKPIYFLGDLIHNEKVVEKFKKGGARFIKNLNKVRSGTLILPAHGFPPLPKNIFKKINVRDATCPLVKKVQSLARFFYEKGYKVIVFGDKNHPEVKGIKSFAKNKAIVVTNEKDAQNLPRFQKIGFISQTTKKKEEFLRILKILKIKSKEVKSFNTLCPEVLKRQKELRKILKIADTALVIGSKKSANTKRLAEIVKNEGKKLVWVNSLVELKRKKIKGALVLGVVSGTSAPNWEVEKIKNYLKSYYEKKKKKNG